MAMGYNRSVDGRAVPTTLDTVRKSFSVGCNVQKHVEDDESFSAEHERYRCKSTFIRKIKKKSTTTYQLIFAHKYIGGIIIIINFNIVLSFLSFFSRHHTIVKRVSH